MAADATTEMLDKIISVLEEMGTKKGIQMNQKITLDEILALMFSATRIIMEDGTLVEVEVPIKVVGDIHGQYEDMHKLFGVIGKVPDVKMIFLGDYVDRGPQSIETIIYLLCLKVKFRDRIYSLRRNHETLTVNRIYGCWNECALKSNVNLWRNFQSFYNRMPMAGLISKRVLCMHGGLSPHLTNLEQICQIKHPCEPSDRGLLIDLIWSDPTNKANGWSNSAGDLSYSFGTGVLLSACKLLKIDLIIKPHQVVQDGYELMVGEKLITIFSAPNYAGQFNNVGAIVCVDGSLQSEGSEEVKTAKLKVEKVRRRETNNKKENSRKEEEEKEKRENVTKDVGEKNEERTRRKRILLKIRRLLEKEKTIKNQVELVMEDLHLFSNGIFSNVYKGLLRQPQHRLIAIKKSWSDQSNQKSMEVQILTMLNRFHHKNIIRLLYKFSQSYPDQKICTALVFDFFPMNLHEVRERYGPLSILDVKLYIWQLFRGQAHLEKNNVCHRDIKPQNLLVDHKSGMLKISDFGSSKIMHEKATSYHYHVTRYYRAPELILGSVRYRCEIDRWSCGCVFGELLKNHVLFPGRTTHHQLQLVINILGYPNSHDITAMRATTEVLESDDFRDDITKKPNSHGFKKLIKDADHNALNLLAQVLVYDPVSRLSGPRFLENSYFNELFDPHTRRNGQRIKILSEKDFKCAVAGDEVLPESVTTEISETSDSPSN
ncbi:phosphoprotein phosphatase 1 domain protein [Onchocerca flexuosa]|uniref:Phosphoprotein phosphatase 1 domain protein n=1 Tax=Onchocerca flexuosa TaxID=387005 RepID=A0A238BY99_9BILA|nr:phosphoprotein phosphatase 1 domain protein [Onchocerca flexuosa]